MNTAPAKERSPRKNIIRIADMRARLARWGKELLDNYAPLNPPKTDGAQFALNIRLWDAFCRKDRSEMVRLVKSGADPHSVERRINREERGSRF